MFSRVKAFFRRAIEWLKGHKRRDTRSPEQVADDWYDSQI